MLSGSSHPLPNVSHLAYTQITVSLLYANNIILQFNKHQFARIQNLLLQLLSSYTFLSLFSYPVKLLLCIICYFKFITFQDIHTLKKYALLLCDYGQTWISMTEEFILSWSLSFLNCYVTIELNICIFLIEFLCYYTFVTELNFNTRAGLYEFLLLWFEEWTYI